MKIVSACLLGVKCKYDGKSRLNKKTAKLSKKDILIPVCPEQLGGLPTPREPSEKRGDKVYTVSRKDVTEQYKRGAEEVLKLAKMFKIKEAILKARSPSCGSNVTRNLKGEIVKGDGMLAALLKKNGIKVVTEDGI